MSFEDLKKDELVALAQKYGVESSGTKAQILAALDEEGVTSELVATVEGNVAVTAETVVEAPVEELPEPLKPAAKPVKSAEAANVEAGILIKYKGQTSYRGQGFVFTAGDPFNVVPSHKAQRFLGRPNLFTRANVSEVEAYYG